MSVVDLLFSGDLILDEPDPDHWLSGIEPALQAAALAVGHLEVAHTHGGQELAGGVPAPGADPAHLSALKRAGFAAVTLAGNHIADSGAEGIRDTLVELDRLGIAHCGAALTLADARRPALLAAGGRTVAVLSYNCVGPETAWAGAEHAGCSYVRIDTNDGSPIAPAAALTRIDPGSMASMQADIARARSSAQIVVVALHKGIVHTPAVLAPYERPLAHAAIDAGADGVIGHHAHILRGIELYRGCPIFHGLGNGCVVTRALSPSQDHPARAEWARRRRIVFGFEPDPAYYLAPFHPEAVNGMLALIRCREDDTLEAGFVPIWVEAPGRPVLADSRSRILVAEYIARITREAGLPPLQLRAEADRMVVA